MRLRTGILSKSVAQSPRRRRTFPTAAKPRPARTRPDDDGTDRRHAVCSGPIGYPNDGMPMPMPMARGGRPTVARLDARCSATAEVPSCNRDLDIERDLECTHGHLMVGTGLVYRPSRFFLPTVSLGGTAVRHHRLRHRRRRHSTHDRFIRIALPRFHAWPFPSPPVSTPSANLLHF